jgi:hypothetical protein
MNLSSYSVSSNEVADYYNISFVLSKTSNDEALKSLYNALSILQLFERENGYRHPLMEKVNSRISYLQKQMV